ncbi:MAG: type II secretion system protein, partial [Patescibacteria group bacterium]
MRNKKGFTLIELLVVIAIIGLLATIAVVALNSARTSSRDAKRIADIRQVQTGLELYFNSATKYPDCTAATRISAVDGCTATGILTYIAGIDNIFDPSGTATATICTVASTTPCDYSYIDSGTNQNDYTMLFRLEGASG